MCPKNGCMSTAAGYASYQYSYQQKPKGPPRPGRLAHTGVAWLYLFLAIPVTALFVLEVVFIPLSLLSIGIFALLAVVPCVAGVAGLHRRLAEYVLGEPVPAPYRASREGTWRRAAGWAADPARWRDLGWLFVTMTLGWVMAILAVAWFLGTLWYLVFPFLFAVTPKGVFNMNLGIYDIDSQGKSFLMWFAALFCFIVWWNLTPALVRAHAWFDRELLSNRSQRLEERVRTLSRTRSENIDFSAAELRRIERDLHDGAQARLVSLGMSLGMAEEFMQSDPEAARRLLAEARESTTAALGDIRSVVRGMHPPVLADRGLVGAIQALALDMAIPVTVLSRLDGRAPLPVESAAYFAVAESLANVAKHSGASQAWVQVGWADGILRIDVGDDGRGGVRAPTTIPAAVPGTPAPTGGTGLLGIARRLAAFDGTLALSSPDGGPTVVRLEVPCVLSSARTTPSSGTV